VGSNSSHVPIAPSSPAEASTRQSASMPKKLMSVSYAWANVLRLTSPNFLVTGPAALVVAMARPRRMSTLMDCFIA
jgi:hypothetical protein